MFQRMKKVLKEQRQKGMTTIEIVISVIIILMTLCGFIDMILNSQKMDTASTVTNYVSRVVASQGGIQTKATSQHLQGYVTSAELCDQVQRMLKKSEIKSNEYVLKIDGKTITPSTNLALKDFGERINVDLSVQYHWKFLHQIVPVSLDHEKTSHREVVSAFKTRNGSISTQYGKDSDFPTDDEEVIDDGETEIDDGTQFGDDGYEEAIGDDDGSDGDWDSGEDTSDGEDYDDGWGDDDTEYSDD